MTGKEDKTTNNRMEIMPILRSLQHIPSQSDVVVYSDSQYVVNSIGCFWKNGKPMSGKKLGWMVKWKKYGWKKRKNGSEDALKNVDLWQAIYKVMNRHSSVEMRWIKGHAGNQLNEACDALANEVRQRIG